MSCPFAKPHALFSDLAAARQRPGIDYNEHLGGYVVSRYDDIVSVLELPEIFSSRPTVPDFPPPVDTIFRGQVPEKGTLLAHDNPDHDRLRKSVASFFSPRRLQRFEPYLRATAHSLIDGFVSDGSVELKSQFALPLPLKTIVTIAGLDPGRWQWIGRCLALFGGVTETKEDLSIQQRVQDVLDLHEYVAGVIQERREDRRDDLISHIWNERDAGTVEMTDYEHLSMIPGLLLAGHETTTNLLSMGMSHLLQHGLWEKASQNDETRKVAIEELLRYESAITGMKRTVTRECEVGGIPFSVGDTLFLAYNSGSRDETKYERPDEIDINRKSKIQHLAFGRGIHACLGAPLARLLLRTELSVLSERLPILRLETPYEDIRYHPVGSGRGPEAVRVAWDPPNGAHAVMPFVDASHLAQQRAAKSAQMSLVVSSAKLCAKRVLHITLAHPDGSELPQWQPGAHIDVKVGKSVFHQYSLCGYPEDRSKYEIAVLEENKTGGSHQIHTTVKAGSCVVIGGPRNNFNFEPGSNKTIFIAGGIGITPIRPMALQAKEAGLDYEILYLGRGKDGMAFADELIDHHAGRLTVWTTDTPGHSRFDLEKYLGSQALDGLRVYCCGPESLLASVEDILRHVPIGTVRLERFAAKMNASKGPNTAFEVILARSNKTIQVSKDESLLDAIINAGGNVLSTCNKGLCGSCEVGVVEGLPDHRDEVLTPLERAEGKTMMACVSRCRGSRLVLDLW